MFRTTCLVLFLTSSLSGCLNPYVIPTGEHLATVKLKYSHDVGSMVAATFDEGEHCKGVRSIMTPLASDRPPEGPWIEPNGTWTIKAVPQDPFTLSVGGHKKSDKPGLVDVCDITFSFAAAADTEYLVDFTWHSYYACRAEIYRIDETPTGPLKTPVLTRQRERWCKESNGKASSSSANASD